MATNQYSIKIARYGLAALSTLHLRLRLANLFSGLFPDFVSGAVRVRLYRMAGFTIGHGAYIMGNLELLSGLEGFYEKLAIGRGAIIGNHVTINLDATVSIGNNVSIGPYVLIYTGTHQVGPGSNRRLPQVVGRPVVIEDGCWIGLAAVVLPGVTIGHGSVIAAGAIVAQDVPPNSYVEGNPAQAVRQLPWGDR